MAPSIVATMTGAKVLVTGSAGHLGEALARVLRAAGHDVAGLDIRPSPYTTVVGSVTDRAVVRECLSGTGAVLHAATLHKPHVGSHGKQAFVDTNVTGTLTLLEEADDAGDVRAAYADANVKANEYLHRRVDIQDAAAAHLLAMARAPEIGFGRYIISATTPFSQADLPGLRDDAPAVVRRLFPDAGAEYARRGWRMFPRIDRVYVNARARADLGWTPRYDFRYVLDLLKAGDDPRSPLARAVGAKGYHAEPTSVYTVR
jgi:UDP-glucose 4-epimerase